VARGSLIEEGVLVAKDGIEPPTQGFSICRGSVSKRELSRFDFYKPRHHGSALPFDNFSALWHL
jgi:hypothetical protein